MSILIADDNEILLILLDKMLQAHNYSTQWATSGAEAWQLLETHPDIRLVIADIMMPEMSGLELLSRMKKSVVYRDIPVILCTVMADVENVRQAALLGCYSYLIKPVQRDQLLQKVHHALAATKPVVSSMRSIQATYGLGKENCIEVIKAFQKLLKAQTEGLEAHQKNPAQAPPPVLLKQLSEGAAILGAEQLEHRLMELSRAMERNVDVDLQLQRLTRDMLQLTSVLDGMLLAAKSGNPAGDTVYFETPLR